MKTTGYRYWMVSLKKLTLMLILSGCIISLSGCAIGRTHTKDPTKEYRSFLNYTAGSAGWKLMDKDTRGYGGDYMIGYESYETFNIQFNDVQGEPLVVTFHNQNLNSSAMLRQVLGAAGSAVGRELKGLLEDQYSFDEEDWLSWNHTNLYSTYRAPVEQWLTVQNVVNETNMWRHLLSDTDGIRLCDVNAQNLLSQQDYYVSLLLLGCHISELEEYKKQAAELYQTMCGYVGIPINMVASLPVMDGDTKETITLAWYAGEDVSQFVDAVDEPYKKTSHDKYAFWFYNKRYPEERYVTDNGPALYNYHRIAVERGLDKEELVEIYEVYRSIFEQYLVEQLPLKKYDARIQEQIEKDDYSSKYYLQFLEMSTMDLNHICVLNFYHVERLDDSQLDAFRQYLASDLEQPPLQLRDIVLETYPRIIPVLTEEELLAYVSDEDSLRYFTNNATYQYGSKVGNYDLYICIVEQRLMSGDGREQRKNFFDKISQELEAGAAEQLDCSVAVRMR